MPRFRNSTNTNFWYFRCKTHYSRIDNSSIYVNIKIYLTILTSLIFLDICIPVPVSLIFVAALSSCAMQSPLFALHIGVFVLFAPWMAAITFLSQTPVCHSQFLSFCNLWQNFSDQVAELIYSILLDVFSCMDYSSLYFLKSVFTFTTIHINCKPGFSF